MEKIRVLHVIEDLSFGGAQRRLANDLAFLDKEVFENKVAYLFDKAGMHDAFAALGVACALLEGGLARKVARLRKLIREFSPDIVHSQLFFANILARLALAGNARVRLVTTLQYPDYDKTLATGVYSLKRKIAERITLFLKMPHMIAVSSYVGDSFRNALGVREAITVIYNSVDIEQFNVRHDPIAKERIMQHYDLKGFSFLLCAAGRLVPQKGFAYALQALAFLKKEYAGLGLVIAGDGPARGELEKLARALNCHDRVRFVGTVDVRDLLRVSDVFVFPTLGEGLPLVLLEAMAMQVLCVASKIPPVEELIVDGKNGFLCVPQDPENLACIISKLVYNISQYDSMRRAARATVADKFEARLCARQLGDFYKDIITR
jgi:glycosyltransferase involved in cell wall biosynthesis